MEEPQPDLVSVIVFPGTDREHDDLFAAVSRNCACPAGRVTGEADRCAPHELLLREPTLKRLVFYRRWRQALRRGEMAGRAGVGGRGLAHSTLEVALISSAQTLNRCGAQPALGTTALTPARACSPEGA